MSSLLHFWIRQAQKWTILWVQSHQQGFMFERDSNELALTFSHHLVMTASKPIIWSNESDGSLYWYSLLLFSSCHPSACLPYTAENKCVTQKTAIKWTSCSLSDPLIKGRYPVYVLALGSGVSSWSSHASSWHWGCWELESTYAAEVFMKTLFSAVPPSLTNRKPSHTVKPEDVYHSSPFRCCLCAGEGFYQTGGDFFFRRCVGSGSGDLAWRKVNKLLLKLSPSMHFLFCWCLLFSDKWNTGHLSIFLQEILRF